MKGIWQEIKNQPPHIREFFMWLCVVITFSVVGFAWFRSTSQQFVALLNPTEAPVTEGVAAKPTAEPPSPFATLYLSAKELWASLGTLFSFSGSSNEIEIRNGSVGSSLSPTPTVKPQKLPVSGSK